jgi:hypothetical protein
VQRTEEDRKKQSATRIALGVARGERNPMFGKVTSGAFKKGHPSYTKGKHCSPETIEKLRQINKGRHLSEQAKEKIRQFRLGRHDSVETRRKKSKAFKGKPHSEEWKRKMREICKRRNELTLKRIMASNRMKPNKGEQQLSALLNSLFPNKFKYVGNGEIFIDGLCPDFINCDGKKQIIEFFGEPFHDPLHTFVKCIRYRQTEMGRMEAFAKYGYSTLIVWSNELKRLDELSEKITEFVRRE